MATLNELALGNARARVERLQGRADTLAQQLRILEDQIRENHDALNRALAAAASLDAEPHDDAAGSLS